MAKILVIRGGAIGDFILTLPVLSALRTQFPEAELEVLGYSHIASLATHGGLAQAVRPIDARPMAGFFAQGADLDPALQRYFAGFALIISFLYDPDEIFRTNVARCSRAQFIVGPHRPDEKGEFHATEVYLKPLERLAIFSPDPVPRLNFAPEVRLDSSAERLLALHPGSGSPRKNWPEAKWNELLARLMQSTSFRVLLVGGEAEEKRLQRLVQGLPADRVEVAQNLRLPELATKLTGCSVFVGHDSGISHLAAALRRPVLALWSETLESVWKPRGENVRVLRHAAGLENLPVERVLDEITALLKSDT
jgi:ADP-heptose:LPS heptosyltransferase